MNRRKIILIPSLAAASVAMLAVTISAASSDTHFFMPSADVVTPGKSFTFDASVAEAQFDKNVTGDAVNDVETGVGSPVHTTVKTFDPFVGLDGLKSHFGDGYFLSNGDTLDEAVFRLQIELNNITSFSVNFGVKGEAPFCCNITCAFFTLEGNDFVFGGYFTYENVLDESNHAAPATSNYSLSGSAYGESEMSIAEKDPTKSNFFNDMTLTWTKTAETSVRKVELQVNAHNRSWDKGTYGNIDVGNIYVESMTFNWSC